MIEMSFADGSSATVGPTSAMFALSDYVENRADKYPLLNELDLFNAVIEADEYEGLLEELRSIQCKGDCPIISNFIAGLETAQADQDEWVMLL